MSDVDRYIKEHWRTTYHLHCQLSAMSLQAAIPEGDSEGEPFTPSDRQAINHKIKKLQDLKKKSEKLKKKEKAQWFTENSGKIICGQDVWATLQWKMLRNDCNIQSNIDQTLMGAEAQKEKHKRMYPFCKRNIRL